MSVQRRSAPRRAGRRALGLIAGLFLGSALLRLVGAVPAAMADAQGEPGGQTAACVTEDGVMELFQAVRDREAAVVDKERRLSERESTVELALAAMNQQKEALIAAEERLSATLAMADQAAEKDVSRLVTVYESMKPKEAAPLFEEMDTDFAAGFIARMKPDAAAAVLSGMDAQKAYLVSLVLAGRNARAPTE
ncbi:hypothetical protein OEW28_00435 [Defluviimonas sp. WL0002]|uniref:Magnesium transporter MgtE intracellular domain-containing protein n=1 Tax=Albidovulum marisflavi TaxID=2984159 RepID=A0ABT2Z7J2_9RHOB|nr:hypothetical protein [Defluviimonas sp. WL0002]MCV2867090.1 hypothetical protein [Defluviimonas sp. WL0002]